MRSTLSGLWFLLGWIPGILFASAVTQNEFVGLVIAGVIWFFGAKWLDDPNEA